MGTSVFCQVQLLTDTFSHFTLHLRNMLIEVCLLKNKRYFVFVLRAKQIYNEILQISFFSKLSNALLSFMTSILLC